MNRSEALMWDLEAIICYIYFFSLFLSIAVSRTLRCHRYGKAPEELLRIQHCHTMSSSFVGPPNLFVHFDIGFQLDSIATMGRMAVEQHGEKSVQL